MQVGRRQACKGSEQRYTRKSRAQRQRNNSVVKRGAPLPLGKDLSSGRRMWSWTWSLQRQGTHLDSDSPCTLAAKNSCITDAA